MIAFSLLISSAFLHALWNAVVKKVDDKDMFIFISMTISYLFAVGYSFGIEGFKYGTLAGFSWSLAAGIFEGFYFLTLAASLRSSSLGSAYAIMRGGAMIVVWFVSLIFLQEKITWLGIAGSILVLVGLVFAQDVKPKALFSGQGSKWPILCAIFIAGYHLCYDMALHQGANPMSSFAIAMVFALPFLIYKSRHNISGRSRKLFRNHKFKIAVTSIAATASFGIFLWGLKISTAPGFAITLRNTSILFAAGFSMMLGDRMRKLQVTGILVIALGAVLLGLS